MAEVSIVNYGIGNTGSICNMFRKLRIEAEVVSSEDSVKNASRLILPGIGAFDACMNALDSSGLRDSVLEFASTQRPMLGICVGMQMLTLDSEEGDMPGLGLIRAHTRRFARRRWVAHSPHGMEHVNWLSTDHPLAKDLTMTVVSTSCTRLE